MSPVVSRSGFAVSRRILDRALRATMHIRSPDRSRSGSAANFGPQRSEDEDLAK
jgi:hypothetical protein